MLLLLNEIKKLEMYGFRYIKAKYDVNISITYPDKEKSSFKSCFYLSARYIDRTEDYVFTLEQQKDVSLNDKEPSRHIDRLMHRLGNTLYPLILRVSSSGKINNIEKFEKTKACWQNESNKIINETPSFSVKQYINFSKKNWINENSFLHALMKNTFILLYFRDETKKDFLFPVYNLTGAGSIYYIQCREKKIDKHTANYYWEDEETGEYCQLNYTYSSLKDITSIKAIIVMKDMLSAKELKKEITISLNEECYKIKKANKIISFLIDFVS